MSDVCIKYHVQRIECITSKRDFCTLIMSKPRRSPPQQHPKKATTLNIRLFKTTITTLVKQNQNIHNLRCPNPTTIAVKPCPTLSNHYCLLIALKELLVVCLLPRAFRKICHLSSAIHSIHFGSVMCQVTNAWVVPPRQSGGEKKENDEISKLWTTFFTTT